MRVPMLRRLKFIPALLAAALALAPAAAPAQGNGLALGNSANVEDSAQAWSICTMVSAYMAEGVVDPAEQELRAEELEMLVAVVMARFMEQQGLTLDQARQAFNAVVAARAPLYENGSGTDRADRAGCILTGMVSQTGDQHAARLLAAYRALPSVMQAAPPAAPAAPAAPASAGAAQAGEIAYAEMDFSAALGSGDNFAAVSYRINPDGSLSGVYGYRAPGMEVTEIAVPRVKGEGLAGIYDASGTGAGGSYTSSFEIVEKYRLDGGTVTVYDIVLAGGGDSVKGTGVYIGGNSLSAVFGADMVGRFHMSEDLAGWDLYLLRDAGRTGLMSHFRFEGAHFEGGHDVLADGVPLGTASFGRDAAGVIRIAMPDGSSVVAVCALEGVQTC